MAVPFNLPSDECTLEQYRRIHRLLLDLMELLRSFTGYSFITALSQQNLNQSADQHIPQPAPVPASNVIPAPVIALPDVVSGTMNTTLQNFRNESVNNDSCYESHNSSPYRRPSMDRRDIPRRRSISCTNRTRRRSIRSRTKLNARRRGSDAVHKVEVEEKENIIVPDICSCPGDSPQCMSVSQSHASGQFYTTVSSCKYRPQQDESAVKVKSYDNDDTKNMVKVPSWLIIGEELRNIANCFNGSKEDNKRTTKISHLKASSLFSLLLPNQIGKTMLATMLIVIGWKLLKQT